MFALRTILLSIGVIWMITLWTITSPLPLTHYLKQPLLPRRLLSTLIIILFFFQLFGYFIVSADWISHNILYGGQVIFFIGVGFASWAKFSMKRNWGEPGQHDIRRQNQLVTSGPFSISRNPIYVGLLLIFLGFELAVGSWLFIGVFPLWYVISLAVKKEEELLEKHFGKTYIGYKMRTPRFL